MPISKPFIKTEANGSTTLEIDLGAYVDVFRQINQVGSVGDKPSYSPLRDQILVKYTGISGGVLALKWMMVAFQCFSELERINIMNSPAYTLLSDSVVELIKNTIDAFLVHQLKNPTDTRTKIALNFQAEVSGERVLFTFSDTGAGFDVEEDLPKWSTEAKQKEYIQQRTFSKKKCIIGLLGGGGFGVRHLIYQILMAEEFTADSTFLRPENFVSSIQFSNGCGDFPGAKIRIMTQLSPLKSILDLGVHTITPQTTVESRTVDNRSRGADATPSPELDFTVELPSEKHKRSCTPVFSKDIFFFKKNPEESSKDNQTVNPHKNKS